MGTLVMSPNQLPLVTSPVYIEGQTVPVITRLIQVWPEGAKSAVKNDYDDGIGKPRTKGLNDKPLPNPRTVSNIINRNPEVSETSSATLTLHAMGFGQFLDHDITLTPEQSVVSDCCTDTFDTDWDNCFSIIIPKDDPYPNIFKKGYCMEVKRSAPVLCADATTKDKVRQQKSDITAFVDGSNIYGSSAERQTKLRKDEKGYLLATTVTADDKERILNGNDAGCILTGTNQHCSLGYVRVNELPSLTSYYYIFVKEHNRIADKIKAFYTDAEGNIDNEKLFQETRRILIAIIQKITYNKFLSSILSPDAMEKHRLGSSADYKYESETNPTIVNAFSTAAYRMGHTWVSQKRILFDLSPTEDNYHDPKMTYLPEAFQRLGYWLSGAASPEIDRILEDAVRNKLFIDVSENKVWDLASLNIQRGRDHGLGSYNKYRERCRLRPVKRDWEKGALPDHSQTITNDLETAGYISPEDIDLWVGGITENRVRGGSLGPTFECIIGNQFKRLKFGDRLRYQNSDAGFNRDQIAAIDEYSFSKVLCNNYDFKVIQYTNAFRLIPDDKLTLCDDIPDLKLDVFAPRKQKKVLSLDDRLEELIEHFDETQG